MSFQHVSPVALQTPGNVAATTAGLQVQRPVALRQPPQVPLDPEQEDVAMIRSVRAAVDNIRPEATNKAYRTKMLEFREFCHKI